MAEKVGKKTRDGGRDRLLNCQSEVWSFVQESRRVQQKPIFLFIHAHTKQKAFGSDLGSCSSTLRLFPLFPRFHIHD